MKTDKMISSTSRADPDVMDIDVEEEVCPLCCEPYEADGGGSSDTTTSGRSRIVCSASKGCGTFSMCRVCVHRQKIHQASPLLVDDDIGEGYIKYDPTMCPQCKQSGAFRDEDLPPLPQELHEAAVEEVVTIAKREKEQTMQLLSKAPYVAVLRRSLEDPSHHGQIQILNGHPQDIRVMKRDGASDVLHFPFEDEGISTVGAPSLLAQSGVLYYEVRVENAGIAMELKFGFSLLSGITKISDCAVEWSIGDGCQSWGVDVMEGCAVTCPNYKDFGNNDLASKWEDGAVIGVAVNVDRGMIAYSTDNNWDFLSFNGVKFEDEIIKKGVFPVISGHDCSVEWNLSPDTVKYGLPPKSLWEAWPKYQNWHWIGLPVEAREAAMALHYTQSTWLDGGNPIEKKKWNELTKNEQTASLVLGYNSDVWAKMSMLWNNEDSSMTNDSDGDDESIESSSFLSFHWNRLPDDAREAAIKLGYSSRTWDERRDVPLSHRKWNALTIQQQQAAIVLGFCRETWNPRIETKDCYFDHLEWADLPRFAREAAKTLGFSKSTWDLNLPGPLEINRWADLTEEEQFAGIALGYNEKIWETKIRYRSSKL